MIGTMERITTTAHRLNEIMQNRGMKQIDIATTSGIRQGTISHYVGGRLIPKADAIAKLSQTLGVSELWLMGYDVPMTAAEVDPETVRNQAIADIALRMQTDDRYRDVVIRLDKLDRKKLDAVAAIVESMQ